MNKQSKLPVIFVRDFVAFPGISATLTVGREVTRASICKARDDFDNTIVVMTQIRAEDEEIKDLRAVYGIGSICKIEKVVALTDGGMQIQIECVERFEGNTLELSQGAGFVLGEVLPDTEPLSGAELQELSTKLSSFQPCCFENPAYSELQNPIKIQQINDRICATQAILQEPSARVRLKLIKAQLKGRD
jgi:ATP-dependent Lon protease